MRLDRLAPRIGKRIFRVVVETPRGSGHKYAYDPDVKGIVLKKSLPEGLTFPFDFGFVPRTVGADGDPLDVLLIADAPTFPGCIVESRIIGLIEAKQKEGAHEERNDRFIAVAEASLEHSDLESVDDLPPHIMKQIEEFFVSYNRLDGKRFKPLRVIRPKIALKRLRRACNQKE